MFEYLLLSKCIFCDNFMLKQETKPFKIPLEVEFVNTWNNSHLQIKSEPKTNNEFYIVDF